MESIAYRVEPGYHFPEETLVVTEERQRWLHACCDIPHGFYGDRADPTESSISGVGGEATLLGGPGLHLGSFTLCVEAQGGVSVPRFAARVTGEAPVQWGGLWAGAAIGIGVREQMP